MARPTVGLSPDHLQVTPPCPPLGTTCTINMQSAKSLIICLLFPVPGCVSPTDIQSMCAYPWGRCKVKWMESNLFHIRADDPNALYLKQNTVV